MSSKILKQNSDTQIILQAIGELSKRLDGFEKVTNERFDFIDAQFETIREGIVHNSIAFDRLQATVLNLRANLTELTEEIRQNQKSLSLK